SLRAVSSDDNRRVHVLLAQHAQAGQLRLFAFEFWKTDAAEHGSAALDNSSHVAKSQRDSVAHHKARIAMPHAKHFPSFVDSGAHSSPDRGIDPWGITACCKYCDAPHSLLRPDKAQDKDPPHFHGSFRCSRSGLVLAGVTLFSPRL